MMIMNLNCNKRIEGIINTREIFVFYNGTLCARQIREKRREEKGEGDRTRAVPVSNS